MQLSVAVSRISWRLVVIKLKLTHPTVFRLTQERSWAFIIILTIFEGIMIVILSLVKI